MPKNRVRSISYLDTGTHRFLTVTRQAEPKVYSGITTDSLRRVCRSVNQRADQRKMSIHLWKDGWTAIALERGD
jgi:ribosomal protein L11 methylase PrmA